MDRKTYESYKEQIRFCPLFSGMEEEEIYRVLSGKDTRIADFRSGMLIDSDALYLVLEGCIVIEKQASDGRYVTMGRAVPSAAVNAASVFLHDKPMSRLLAQEDSTLLRIGEKSLRAAIMHGGLFALNMTEFLAGRVRFLNQKITSLAGYSASSRLQMYLEENNVRGEVVIPMSMTDFADFLGVGRASLYRTLDQMQKDGKIERSGRTIRILSQ